MEENSTSENRTESQEESFPLNEMDEEIAGLLSSRTFDPEGQNGILNFLNLAHDAPSEKSIKNILLYGATFIKR